MDNLDPADWEVRAKQAAPVAPDISHNNTTEQGALDMLKEGFELIRRAMNYIPFRDIERHKATDDMDKELPRSKSLTRELIRVTTLLDMLEENAIETITEAAKN